jgi:hypothetical protein
MCVPRRELNTKPTERNGKLFQGRLKFGTNVDSEREGHRKDGKEALKHVPVGARTRLNHVCGFVDRLQLSPLNHHHPPLDSTPGHP